jgi:putative transposase
MLLVLSLSLLSFLIAVALFYEAHRALLVSGHRTNNAGFRRRSQPGEHFYRFTRKPDWVTLEIVRLKAFLPDSGVRAIAITFNRLHRTKETVSKSFVAGVIRKHRYAITVKRRDIHHRPPRAVAINSIWGLDLCGKQSVDGICHSILGIIDHGSRLAVMLQGIRHQNFYTLAGHVLIAIGMHGKPTAIRTDNASTLTSKRFRRFLTILGIRHQRTELGCPWQNGRIERLFGTLKAKLDLITVANDAQLNIALKLFRTWYNEIRPHQNLAEKTPAEAWSGINTNDSAPRSVRWFSSWDGLLTGYRIGWC